MPKRSATSTARVEGALMAAMTGIPASRPFWTISKLVEDSFERVGLGKGVVRSKCEPLGVVASKPATNTDVATRPEPQVRPGDNELGAADPSGKHLDRGGVAPVVDHDDVGLNGLRREGGDRPLDGIGAVAVDDHDGHGCV